MSQEAWGQIIIHEILHSFINRFWPQIARDHLDHLFVFKNFTEPTRDLLIKAFGMDSTTAIKLALNGIKDNWGYSDLAQMCLNKYGVTLDEIDAVYKEYTSGIKGRKCS
jgi:hypothetical protein